MKALRRVLPLVVALALVTLGRATVTRAAGGPLDGKSFAGEMGEAGKTAGDKDEFVFADGTFHSLSCDQYGFGSAPYVATPGNYNKVTFQAETTSAKEGKMQWKGTARGDSLEGRVVWIKGDQKISYWFKGKLKKP